jgi:hypothetical protein
VANLKWFKVKVGGEKNRRATLVQVFGDLAGSDS